MKLTESAAADPQPGAAEAALTPFGRYCAHIFAVVAYRSTLTAGGHAAAAEKVRGFFTGCAEAGYGFPSVCEAAVLSELAAIAAGAAS